MSNHKKKRLQSAIPPYNMAHLHQILFDQSTDGIFITDLQSHCVDANQQACKMAGCTQEELLTLPLSELILVVDSENSPFPLADLEIGQPFLLKCRLRRPNGRLLPVEINGRRFSADHVLVMARDLSNQQEHQLRTLMKNSPDFIGRYDEKASVTYINPALEQLFGKPLSDVLGKTFTEISPGVKGAQRFEEMVREVLKTGTPIETEIIVDELPDQEPFYHHLQFIPERNHEGQTVSVLFIGRDITTLKATERQLRALTENSPDIIARLDREGRYLYVNNAMQKMTGIPVQKLMGQRLGRMLSEYLPSEPQPEILSIQQAIKEVALTGMATEMEGKLTLLTGEYIFNIRLIPESNQAGQVVSTLLIARDITEKHKATHELHHNREAALQFSKQLATLQEITTQLSKAKSTDDLCRNAVLFAKSHLGFERTSIWFIEDNLNSIRGSFGTDEQGQLRDERHSHVEFKHVGLTWRIYNQKESMAVVERRSLSNHLGQVVGEGENAVAALWDGDEVIGVLSVDNFFTGNSITAQQLEVLRLYATTLGHLITLKRAEEALLVSEARFRALVNHAADAFFLTDDTGSFLDVNLQACKSLGYEREELIGMNSSSIDDDFTGSDFAQLGQRLKVEEIVTLNTHHRRKDGTVFPVEIRISPFWQDGKMFSVALARDITKRKQTQEKLILFRSLIDNANDIIEVIEPETGNFLDVNEHACRVHGYTREEYLNLSVSSINPRVAERGWKLLLRDLKKSGSLTRESLHRRKDGSLFPVEINITYIPEYDYVIAVVRDITERKHAEAILREQEKHSRSLLRLSKRLEQAQNFNAILNAARDEIKTILGYQNLWVYLLSEDQQFFISLAAEGEISSTVMTDENVVKLPIRGDRMLEAIVNNEDIIVIEDARTDERVNKEIVTQLGNRTIVNVPIFLADKQLGAVGMGTFGDEGVRTPTRLEREYLAAMASHLAAALDRVRLLMERIRAEEEVRQLNQELEQRVTDRTAKLEAANNDLQSFAYSVSHDLRAPLRAMDGFARMLSTTYQEELPDRAQHYLERIQSNAHRMGLLIDDLLELSRVGRQKIQWRTIDLNQLINEVINNLTHDDQIGRAQFTISELPSCQGDTVLLKQLIFNLITNAIKYSGKTGTPQITIGHMEQDNEVVYFVRDNGIGFDMQYADKLFGVFQRLHTAEEYEGTGIGLATVHRIIQSHNGRIWAESAVNEGATFYFTINPQPSMA